MILREVNENLNTELATLSTLNDVIRWAVSRFNEANIFLGHGTNTMWDEALALILPALFLKYDLPEQAWYAHLTFSELKKVFNLIELRVRYRIPTAYLTNTARFCHLSFYVDPRVLIPRSPIAECILKNFHPWINTDRPLRILDLCTGSGCIAIACAYYFPNAIVDAVDISSEALAVAEMNVKKTACANPINLYQGDLFNPVKNNKYDLIISNPPYVDQADLKNLPKEYSYEPVLALYGGEDGLKLVKNILAHAKDFLNPKGILVVEVGNSEEALIEEFPEIPFTWLEFEQGEDGVFLLEREDIG